MKTVSAARLSARALQSRSTVQAKCGLGLGTQRAEPMHRLTDIETAAQYQPRGTRAIRSKINYGFLILAPRLIDCIRH